ncbi:MAG TPA: efflux RND transporter periplasmic adaptor subunit [Gammaproteobacteria bacterium]|nr:efflux RND transporter periplasmic adaptor subunit [Gammaproteobacteria bacterium]
MKNAVLIVLAFALGGGAVWYFMRDDGAPAMASSGRPVGFPGQPGGPGGRPGGGGPAGAGGFGQTQLPLVVVAAVKRQPIYDVIEALGTAQANESVTITAKVTDTVRRVNFNDGDFIQAGAVLVELTNQEEEASLAEARANLDDAENQLRRQQDIHDRGLGSASDFDLARSRQAAQQARLNTVVARLKDRVITAPFSGMLGFRQVSPGTLVSANTPITSIDDISTIKLDFTVPETFLGTMNIGAKVIAESVSYPDRKFEGIVKTVGSRVDPVTRSVTVRAHVLNADHALRPGMLLTVQVVTAEHLALVVPEGAVFQVQNRAYVYTASDQTAHQTLIEVGGRRFGIVEVLGGLKEGDIIVTEGIVKLREGAKFRTNDAETAVSDRSDSAEHLKPRTRS